MDSSKMDNDQQQYESTVWQFANCYAEKYGFLPPSQRREVVKRLTGRRRNPLTVEGCAQESPDVEAVLAQVWAAYQRKKERSKQASAARRVSVAQAQEGAEPEAELRRSVCFSELSIEPEPALEPEPQPEPALEPELLQPEEPLPAPLPPIKRATSQRPPPATPREPQLAQPQPRRSLFQAPAPATPVAAQPKKVAAGGLRAALMKRGA